MSYGYTYTFPALRGIQAGREYFVAMCPLKLLPKIFLFDEAPIPPELRAQRTLNRARVPEIAHYILKNRDDYAFSAITASVDGEVRFEPANTSEEDADVGWLTVPMSARFVINDGQHRRAAIEAALEEDTGLGDETIAVVLFLDAGLHRSQQLFADLNKHAIRPTKSLGILYDCRDPLATLSRDLAGKAKLFKGLTELEKATISNRAIKLFTLSAIYQATGALLNKRKNDSIDDKDKKLALRFWNELAKVVPEWQLVIKREVSSADLRNNYVHSHSVALHALGLAGHTLLLQQPGDWPAHLKRLRDVDWSRSNVAVWEGRAMSGGRMSKSRQNVRAIAIFLKKALGLTLTSAEIEFDDQFNSLRLKSALTQE